MKKIQRAIRTYMLMEWCRENFLWTFAAPTVLLCSVGLLASNDILFPYSLKYLYIGGMVQAAVQALAYQSLPGYLADTVGSASNWLGTTLKERMYSNYLGGWHVKESKTYLRRWAKGFSVPQEDIPRHICEPGVDPVVKYVIEWRLAQ